MQSSSSSAPAPAPAAAPFAFPLSFPERLNPVEITPQSIEETMRQHAPEALEEVRPHLAEMADYLRSLCTYTPAKLEQLRAEYQRATPEDMPTAYQNNFCLMGEQQIRSSSLMQPQRESFLAEARAAADHYLGQLEAVEQALESATPPHDLTARAAFNTICAFLPMGNGRSQADITRQQSPQQFLQLQQRKESADRVDRARGGAIGKAAQLHSDFLASFSSANLQYGRVFQLRLAQLTLARPLERGGRQLQLPDLFTAWEARQQRLQQRRQRQLRQHDSTSDSESSLEHEQEELDTSDLESEPVIPPGLESQLEAVLQPIRAQAAAGTLGADEARIFQHYLPPAAGAQTAAASSSQWQLLPHGSRKRSASPSASANPSRSSRHRVTPSPPP